jgi:nucleoside-diphosphate-sugar epimerase
MGDPEMKLTDKRILITGADGFIGSHLTETLLDMGCQVRALSLYDSFNDWGWLEVIQDRDNLEVVCGDVRDPHSCKQLTQEIDVIFHLAALIAIPYSYVAPDYYVDTNIKGTLNICQAGRDPHSPRLLPAKSRSSWGMCHPPGISTMCWTPAKGSLTWPGPRPHNSGSGLAYWLIAALCNKPISQA